MTEQPVKQKLGPNQEKWVQALESGEYLQGIGHLNINNTNFCCLGVLCELESSKLTKRLCEHRRDILYDNNSCFLPDILYNLYGFMSRQGDFKGNVGMDCSLASLNDNGVSFKEIAQIIRDDPSNVFTKEY